MHRFLYLAVAVETRVLIGLIGLTAMPLNTLASESTKNSSPTSTLSSLPQLLLGLFLVLTLILGAAWLMKRMGMTSLHHTGLLKVVSSISVGSRERIAVIELDETWIVVGITANQIQALHTQAKGTLPATSQQPHAAKFSQVLAQLTKK